MAVRRDLTIDGAVQILAANRFGSNTDLLIACRDLGYIGERVLDPTYGRGNWWTKWRPADLTCHDIASDGVDFRDLPHDAGSFDTVAFDPPYIPQGGRTTSTEQGFLERYGLLTVPKTSCAS